jgi:hypothetical protein
VRVFDGHLRAKGDCILGPADARTTDRTTAQQLIGCETRGDRGLVLTSPSM